MGTYHISFMENNDLRESARVLSIAMLDNPLHLAVYEGNGEHERLKIEQGFVELFTQRPGIVFVVQENESIVGAMRMISCVGKTPEGEPEEPQADEDTSSRKSVWFREWAIRDPQEQHWHLGPIGVLPSHRRLGIGSQLMERFCQEVDRCAAKAYLETDSVENVRFYQKFGFEVISTSDIFQVENHYMIRGVRQDSRRQILS